MLHSTGTNSVMAGVSFQGDVSMWISVSARQRAPTALFHCQGTSTPTIHQQQAYTHREHKEPIPAVSVNICRIDVEEKRSACKLLIPSLLFEADSILALIIQSKYLQRSSLNRTVSMKRYHLSSAPMPSFSSSVSKST